MWEQWCTAPRATRVPLLSSLCTMEMWLRAMTASSDSEHGAPRHFLSTVVRPHASSCSARHLWLEMSMMTTSRPFLTDSMHLHRETDTSTLVGQTDRQAGRSDGKDKRDRSDGQRGRHTGRSDRQIGRSDRQDR